MEQVRALQVIFYWAVVCLNRDAPLRYLSVVKHWLLVGASQLLTHQVGIGSPSSAHPATFEKKSNKGQGFSILAHMRSYWLSLWSRPSLPKRGRPSRAIWKCLARRRVFTHWCCFHVAIGCMAHQSRITSSGMEVSC